MRKTFAIESLVRMASAMDAKFGDVVITVTFPTKKAFDFCGELNLDLDATLPASDGMRWHVVPGFEFSFRGQKFMICGREF